MAPKPETIQRRMKKRVETAARRHDVLEAHFDPDSGAAVVVGRPKEGGKLVALFFTPSGTNRYWTKEITAHDRVNLGAMLKKRVAKDADEKTRPHDFKVGEIYVSDSGVAAQYHSFHRVVDVPDPHHITIVEMPSKVIHGELLYGTVVPDEEAPLSETAPRFTIRIRMTDDGPEKMRPIKEWRSGGGRRWDGKPRWNFAD